MIKNQFYSTLRRQQRKINKLLVSKEFQTMVGGKTSEITSDELYKFIKDGKLEYEDIKGIYNEALTDISSEKFNEFKNQASNEVKAEREFEERTSLNNRRSYRLSKKRSSSETEDLDITTVSVIVLFKVLCEFREKYGDNLPVQVSDSSPMASENKDISKSIQKTVPKVNKRKKKEEFKKIDESEVSELSMKHSKFEQKYSATKDDRSDNSLVVPNNHKLLFEKMKNSEEDYTLPKGINLEDYRSNSGNKSKLQRIS